MALIRASTVMAGVTGTGGGSTKGADLSAVQVMSLGGMSWANKAAALRRVPYRAVSPTDSQKAFLALTGALADAFDGHEDDFALEGDDNMYGLPAFADFVKQAWAGENDYADISDVEDSIDDLGFPDGEMPSQKPTGKAETYLGDLDAQGLDVADEIEAI